MSNFCNSNFISNSFNNSIIDLMSCTSDSYPIGPVDSTSASGGFIYGSFMCVGDLLVQFSSNQSNALLVNSNGSCIYPIEMSGSNLPNTFLITGNNDTTDGSVVAAYDVSSSGFGYSNVPTGNNNGSYINFLCISPRPAYFKPKVPFITTGSPYIYWSSSTTLTLLYTDATNPGSITFADTSSMGISINLMSGGGGGGSGGTGGDNGGAYVGGQGGTGGAACQSAQSVLDVSLNTQYYCVVGKGGTGGPSVSYNNNNKSKGNDGQNGSPSWVGPSYDVSSACLALATGNNTGGSGGGNSVQLANASDNAVNGLGGYGGTANNNGYTNDGQDGADYSTRGGTYTTNVMGGTNIAYAAGGGGGKYHNGNPGNGGNGSPNQKYGGGGNGGGNSGSDGVSPSISIGSVFSIGTNWGGGGGGGGGGNCDPNGNGSTSGAGGNGADGYIQITLTFNS
jgi:hypothetical protein